MLRRICVAASFLLLHLFPSPLPVFSSSEALAADSIAEVLAQNPSWKGTAIYNERGYYEKNSVEITFEVSGSPPEVKGIRYQWENEKVLDINPSFISVKGSRIEFLIPPQERDRWYKLDLQGEILKGTLTGIHKKDPGRRFTIEVELRPKK